MASTSNPAEQLAQLDWLLAGEPQSAAAGYQLLPRALCLPLLQQHQLVARVASILAADGTKQHSTDMGAADLHSARDHRAWALLRLYANQAAEPWSHSISAFAALMLDVLGAGSVTSRWAFGPVETTGRHLDA